jgi:hypothetical protein
MIVSAVLNLALGAVGLPFWSRAAAAETQRQGAVDAQLHEDRPGVHGTVADDPALPRVLLIGDSISIGYTTEVRKRLAGKANVHRPPCNCQHTGHGLENIDTWLGTGRWDVIHFNWGIWDTHMLDKTGKISRIRHEVTDGSLRQRFTPAEYGDNLRRLTDRLQTTGATLIWATTTPVLFRTGERLNAVPALNEVADGLMREKGIVTNDLYGFVLPNAAAWQKEDRCHFNEVGNRELGGKVAEEIERALARRNRKQEKREAP